MRLRAVVLVLLSVALAVQGAENAYDWSSVDHSLQASIDIGAFPGCVAIVANKDTLYAKAFGHFTYGDPAPMSGTNPAMQLDTLFDMASCTKVLATTSAVAQFYQRGELDLDMAVSHPYLLGPAFAQNGKAAVTVRNLLLHNAGFPPDPDPNFNTVAFGCPESKQWQPQEVFSCRGAIFNAVMAQKLQNPVGSIYVYSDLSFITLSYVVGRLAMQLQYVSHTDLLSACVAAGAPGLEQCYYEAYVRLYVVEGLKLPRTGFLPPRALWAEAAPTENDTSYLHRTIQGQVSDGNAYASGGIQGHAGLFSTALDATVIMQRLLFASPTDAWLNQTTVELFTREYNHTQSSRALGWNTNDPTAYDMGWNLSCGHFVSPRTFMHTGYTGTMVCGDPDNQVVTVLLTNRVYPTDANVKIHAARQSFADAVACVLGYAPKTACGAPQRQSAGRAAT